jgi:hypothetical protein
LGVGGKNIKEEEKTSYVSTIYPPKDVHICHEYLMSKQHCLKKEPLLGQNYFQ